MMPHRIAGYGKDIFDPPCQLIRLTTTAGYMWQFTVPLSPPRGPHEVVCEVFTGKTTTALDAMELIAEKIIENERAVKFGSDS